ncbi:MAG TPA: RICIN domain-containing protein [Candidatus Lumbricidophila sp.]|nr:RICIN domain-containing protein [Candidatus Lumbricidophila sp.]
MTPTIRIRRRARLGACVAVSATVLASLSGLAAGAAPAAAASTTPTGLVAAVAGEITQTMTYNGKTVTVRLQPFQLRGAKFEVLVQQADGSLARQSVRGERAFLGSVDGDSAARVSAIRKSDGSLEGKIVFDRGQAQWSFRDGTVTGAQAQSYPDFKWPVSDDVNRLVSAAPGQAGANVYLFDVGYDATSEWVNDSSIGGSVDKALDIMEQEIIQMASTYINTVKLRPALGRIILRADPTHDPYRDGGGLSATQAEWSANQSDANVDVIVQHREPNGSGGVAFVSEATTDWGIARVSGRGVRGAVRHEVGHLWSVDDNHTQGPEGPTIMSGNTFDRFDGTEVSSIFRYRDRASVTAKLVPMGNFDQPMPPYAALDLIEGTTAGIAKQVNPIANDHDANGDALALDSVQATSKLGGTASLGANNTVVYTAPAVTDPDTVDWVTYVVRDATGRTATGVIEFKVAMGDPGPVSSWPNTTTVSAGSQVGFINKQSGLAATARSENPASADLLQRANSQDDVTLFNLVAAGGDTAGPFYRLKNAAAAKCMDVTQSVTSGSTVTQSTCSDLRSLKWRLVDHPRGGVALVSVKSGLCLAPQNGSLAADAVLTQITCGADRASAWNLKSAPISRWKAATVDATKQYVLQVRSNSAEVWVDGSEWVQLAAAGTGTPFTITQNTTGTWMIKNPASSNRCLVNYHNANVDVAQRGCGTEDSQSWRLLQHPLGGVAIQSASGGRCIQSQNGSTNVGSRVVFGDCSDEATQRWNLVATPAS